MKARNEVLLAGREKKVLADDIVTVRAARTPKEGETIIPLIVSIPKPIAEIMKIEKGNKLVIYTDGDQIYLRRYERPKL